MIYWFILGCVILILVAQLFTAGVYVVVVHGCLGMAHEPDVQAKLSAYTRRQTIHAISSYKEWITIWVPLLIVAITNICYVVVLFIMDIDISELHTIITAFGTAFVFVTVRARQNEYSVYEWIAGITIVSYEVQMDICHKRLEKIVTLVETTNPEHITFTELNKLEYEHIALQNTIHKIKELIKQIESDWPKH